jgi:hypothetical protein
MSKTLTPEVWKNVFSFSEPELFIYKVGAIIPISKTVVKIR